MLAEYVINLNLHIFHKFERLFKEKLFVFLLFYLFIFYFCSIQTNLNSYEMRIILKVVLLSEDSNFFNYYY